LHQVGDLFELNVKLRCQRVKDNFLAYTRNVILPLAFQKRKMLSKRFGNSISFLAHANW